MAPINLVCVAFVVRSDGIGLLGECILEGYGWPPHAIANGEPFDGSAEPVPTPHPRSAIVQPYFRLKDTNEVVWGCECMWMPIDRWTRLLPNIQRTIGDPIPTTLLAIRNADDFFEN